MKPDLFGFPPGFSLPRHESSDDPERGEIVLDKRVTRVRSAFGAALRTFATLIVLYGAAQTVATGEAQANSKYSGIVVDAKTGKTLYAYKADTKRYPASTTKIMTLYILFEELEAGRLSLNSNLKVSAAAAAEPPSKLGLKPGSTIKVRDAILALVTKSANDVATVVAENISGSERNFARRMTDTARRIGMKSTTFRNAHGLPDAAQVTTARDMALLGRAIQDRFPKYYKYFSTRSYTFRGQRYGNHNRLLGRVEGVDGIKTGYIRASGFNLVTSVKRDGRSIVAVVFGGTTGSSRDAQMRKLIAEYLPKASRGRRTAPLLVAAPAEVPVPVPAPSIDVASATRYAFDAAELVAPPVPGAKPGADPVIVTGSIPVPPAPVPHTRETPVERVAEVHQVAEAAPRAGDDTRIVRTQTITAATLQAWVDTKVQQTPAAPMPVATPAPSTERSSTTTTVATNNTPDPTPGWHVQIAAAETEDKAVAMLKRAQTSVGGALRGYDPYTEPVVSGGATLYRARFVGFTSKTAALNACQTLKKAKFDCFAIYQ